MSQILPALNLNKFLILLQYSHVNEVVLLKGNLLSYIKEYYDDSSKAKVDKFLDRNRSTLFKIEKWNHFHFR